MNHLFHWGTSEDAQTFHCLEKRKYRRVSREDEFKATAGSQKALEEAQSRVRKCHSTYINTMFQDETVNTEFNFILFQFRA